MFADLEPDERVLQELADTIFARHCPPDSVRRYSEGDTADVARRWAALGAGDLLGVCVPETYGGLELGHLSWALVVEAAGRAAAPEPVADATGVANALLAGDAAQSLARDWLPRVVGGEAVIGIQLDPAAAVPGADVVDAVLAIRGDRLHFVDCHTVDIVRVESIDPTRRLFRLPVDLADCPSIPVERQTVTAARAVGVVGLSATLLGLADTLLAWTVDYVKTREQFGRPVGSFQAIQHKLADCRTALEIARPALWQAAHRLDHWDDDTLPAVWVAQLKALEASALINDAALQCHGAIGFTWEYDLQLYLKRAKALERSCGTADEIRERLATALFDHDQLMTGSPGVQTV